MLRVNCRYDEESNKTLLQLEDEDWEVVKYVTMDYDEADDIEAISRVIFWIYNPSRKDSDFYLKYFS